MTEQLEKLQLPVIPLMEAVAFPSIGINFEPESDLAVAAAAAAGEEEPYVFLVAQRAPIGDTMQEDDLFTVGTVAKIRRSFRRPDGAVHLICDGMIRATLEKLHRTNDYYTAEVICRPDVQDEGDQLMKEALLQEAKKSLPALIKCLPSLSAQVQQEVLLLRDPDFFSDFVAAHILVRVEDKQSVLEIFSPTGRLVHTLELIGHETKMLLCERAIHKQVGERLANHQKEMYLREELRVIEEELGDGDNEIREYERRIKKAALPAEVEKKLLKENERMSKTSYGSAEAGVLRSYLDICLELPWNKLGKDRIDLAAAKKVLDADHDGLQKVKERILEYLAVKKLNPELKGQILCLVGPPGVGKTSVARSIARAMNRKYVRVSLGGVRDEADIRGHRKTYLGAMPGRIIDAVSKAEVRNPLILLDEIDKLTKDAHGDPSSALLEVLDSEQNKTFRDHFVELPFDLSDCIFIATANTLETISRPLIDRMEIIELSTYSKREKMAIAEHHLIGKQMKRHGLNKRMLKLPAETVETIIEDYTREAGVRNLERSIADICRKAARKIAAGEAKSVTVLSGDLPDYLGTRTILHETVGTRDFCGVVNGLAYTEAGGDLLKVEALVLPGDGKIELTGSLGDVMKESARIAVSYIRAHAAELGVDPQFPKKCDLHIHFPEGAVPKDGPSAGAAMVTALVSALSGKTVRHEVAMTGEATLTGEVLAIGGLKEKTMAAVAAGAAEVLIPADNLRDLPDLDADARARLKITPCHDLSEVLCHALTEKRPPRHKETLFSGAFVRPREADGARRTQDGV